MVRQPDPMIRQPDRELLQDVHKAREEFRGNDTLPAWSEFEWVGALTVQLGKCGVYAGVTQGAIQQSDTDLHEIDRMRRDMRVQLVGLVGLALDAIEDVDRRLAARADDPDAEGMAAERREQFGTFVKLLKGDGFDRGELIAMLGEALG